MKSELYTYMKRQKRYTYTFPVNETEPGVIYYPGLSTKIRYNNTPYNS